MNPKPATSGLLSFLFSWHRSRVVEQVAGEVARECRSGLWQRLCARAANMTPAEARGYIRAQAAGCVAGEVEQAMQRRHLNAGLRSRLIDASIDQVVNMVAHDMLSVEPPAQASTMAA